MQRTFSTLIAIAAASLFASAATAQEVRIARQFSMGYLQFNVMEHEKLLEKHAAALGLKDVKTRVVDLQRPGRDEQRADLRLDRRRGGRRAGAAHAVEPDQGNAERGARHFGALGAAVPAQHALGQHQVDRGPEGLGPHRGAGREGLGAGGGPADGRRETVGREKFRQARPDHRVDVAAGCDHRAAVRLGRGEQRVQCAAVPAGSSSRSPASARS